MSRTVQPLPKARTEQLVIKELSDETLVYDETNHEAHCLNRTAAFVWRHCDGRTSVAKIARLLTKEMNTPVSEQLVWFALSQLEKAQLLEKHLPRPINVVQISRRELMRRLGIAAAVALPLVTSIVAPTTAEAASGCLGAGQLCTSTAQCCPGLTCGFPPTEGPRVCQ